MDSKKNSTKQQATPAHKTTPTAEHSSPKEDAVVSVGIVSPTEPSRKRIMAAILGDASAAIVSPAEEASVQVAAPAAAIVTPPLMPANKRRRLDLLFAAITGPKEEGSSSFSSPSSDCSSVARATPSYEDLYGDDVDDQNNGAATIATSSGAGLESITVPSLSHVIQSRPIYQRRNSVTKFSLQSGTSSQHMSVLEAARIALQKFREDSLLAREDEGARVTRNSGSKGEPDIRRLMGSMFHQ